MDTSQTPPVDLTNCDVEPIHIPGSIQPHGALLAFDVGLTTVLRHSRNAEEMLGLSGTINGAPADALLGSALTHSLRNALTSLMDPPRPALLFNQSMPSGKTVDIAIHRFRSTVIVEFEPMTESGDKPLQLSRSMIDRIAQVDSVEQLTQRAAQLVRGVLGYDRVMIYQFERDGAGKVIAEVKRADLESFLGQYFPGSDIPQQARALYLKNTIRIISSSSYQPIPLVPQFDLSGEPLDLSFAHLRSVSPIHLEYLRNMGVGASMSISIIVDGELWGLIACHHYSERTLPMGLRVAAELFGDFFSLHLGALRNKRKLELASNARNYVDRVLKLASQRDLEEVLVDSLGAFGKLVANDGFALYFNGRWTSHGMAPSAADASALAQFVGGVANGRVWATHSLAGRFPEAEVYYESVSGLLAIPISHAPRDHLFFFRKELVQTLNWAGNPQKSYESGPLGDRLTPRKSFDIWKETVHKQARPWSESDREVAEATRAALVEVVLRHSEILEDVRAKAEVRQRLLNEELNHRVKNILSVIKSLVAQPPQEGRTLNDYVASLKGRIQALSLAHDQIVRGEGGGMLSDLVAAELTPYRNASTDIELGDEGVWLDSRAYSVMALVLHELATNAAKYGALSAPGGRLSVAATFASNGDCALEWIESGGPPVTPPSREGFGTALIDRSVPFDLGGDSEVRYAPEGVRAQFRLPARHVRRKHPTQTPAAAETVSSTEVPDLPRDLRIMLLEDQMLIAMDVEAMLADQGFTHVSTVNSAADALKLIARAAPAAALLDINLADGTSLPVAEALEERGVPFVFATGYGEGGIIPARFATVPVVRKPYDATALLLALDKVMRR